MHKIEAWVNNFQKANHRYIAAQILDRLIYRSNKMAKESYRSFLISTLRDFYFDSLNLKPEPIYEWIHQLSIKNSRYSNNLVIAPVRCISDSGASGDTICRMVEINQSFTKYLTEEGFGGRTRKRKIPRGMVILLVDDMLGSGKQILDFSKAVNLERWAEQNHVVYAPLIAFEKNLERIKSELPYLAISPIEILEEKQCFFSFEENANFIGCSSIKEQDAIIWYNQMLSSNKISTKNSCGRENAALTLAFQWGCPNQTH
ncbi:MAG: hypothetical protein Q8L73_00760 [Methylotenera sp.]|nr:hypothetical protein [Methylotenera sp.]